MAAFVTSPLGASTLLPASYASSFRGAAVSRSTLTHPRPVATRTPAFLPAITCEEKQFNYNIYQDMEDRSKRAVTSDDRAVIMQKPLGIVLEEGQDGMVFVAEVDPDGNAADTGEVNEGDIVVAVSATFGEEVWSTRGVGLDRVMKSIRIRAGDFVTIVLESPDELSERKQFSASQAVNRRSEARDKFGEREVLDPVSWTSVKKQDPTFEYGDPAQPDIDEQLKEKLKNEIVAPYQQNWILWVGGAVFALVILSVVFGIN